MKLHQAFAKHHPPWWGVIRALAVTGTLAGFAGCGDSTPSGVPKVEETLRQCLLDLGDVADGGVGRDGIPALTDPAFVSPVDPRAGYVSDDDRVVGIVVDGSPHAIPHNVLYFHEVVNLSFDDAALAVTYCPLTGSSVVFGRSSVDGAEFGVSGLLLRNNLILYDRNDDESLWPQLLLGAACGPRKGVVLPRFPMIELRWDAWLELNPDTKVLAKPEGFGRSYTLNPLVDYERLDNADTPFPVPLDERRPPKERVIGVPTALDGGTAFPTGELSKRATQAIPVRLPGQDGTLFWSTPAQGGAVYVNQADDRALTFRSVGRDIFDNETGSRWGIHGQALDGPLAGARLPHYAGAVTAFWFAWADFRPETVLWIN